MKLKRETILKVLKLLNPAVGDKSPLESLQFIWFDQEKKTAFAYNGVIGIECAFSGEITGGIGQALLGILDHSAAEEVELIVKGAELQFIAGGAKGKLPLKAIDGAVRPFPLEDEERTSVVLAGDAVAAMKHVMPTASGSGVTLMPEGPDLMFYSTDGKSISWSSIPLPEDYTAPRLLLAPEFCERLLTLLEDGVILEVLKDKVVAVFESNVLIFSRLLEQEHPLDFSGRIAAAIPDAAPLPIPGGMADALERVLVLASGKVAKMQAFLSEKELRLEFKPDLSTEIIERFPLEPHNHGTITAAFDAQLISRGMGSAKFFVMGERAFLLLDDAGRGYVSAAIRG